MDFLKKINFLKKAEMTRILKKSRKTSFEVTTLSGKMSNVSNDIPLTESCSGGPISDQGRRFYSRLDDIAFS